MLAFGPVPSRRLGQSLGINNIPPKVCTYSCVYCQLGRTMGTQVERSTLYQPQDILKDVRDKVKKVEEMGESVDYLTFVPDGEPTLDINLGCEIELLKTLGIKIAVITNASLIWREDVREDLMKADFVSLKVDSTREKVWRTINRPHHTLRLASILDGMLKFARVYGKEVVTETMLVKGINDSSHDIKEVADFLSQLKPTKAYISIPTRPPAEKWVQPSGEDIINQAYNILSERIDGVELLTGYEGSTFAFTGNVEEDLMSITAVHPMREDAMKEFLARAKADWTIVQKLINLGQLIEIEYNRKRFYMRRFNRKHGKDFAL
jgi:wyosine [tRNA(Phe)-imidazoG37] synthetase (radical SAM superfamily)